MHVPISEIKINPGRRKAVPGGVRELADSIAAIGLLNPITISSDHTLIAGLHRLEAAKLLGWTEIECTVSSLEGLRAELAEIDENFVRRDLTPIEYGEMLLRRKEIYEALHPESIQTNQGGPFCGNQHREVSDKMTRATKSFSQGAAGKLGVSRRTVERQVQIAKRLTLKTKKIIRDCDTEAAEPGHHAGTGAIPQRTYPNPRTSRAGCRVQGAGGTGMNQSTPIRGPPAGARPVIPAFLYCERLTQ